MGAAKYPTTISDAATLAQNFKPESGMAPPARAVFKTEKKKPYPKKTSKSKESDKDDEKEEKKDTGSKRRQRQHYPYDCPLGCGEKHPAHLCPRIEIAKKAIQEQGKKVHFQRSTRDEENTIGVFVTSTQGPTLTPHHILLDLCLIPYHQPALALPSNE